MIATNQTGRFPVKSSKGKSYIMGWFPLIATFSITCRGGARYLAIAQNSFKILRIE
jgi:hypothetical protein